MPRTESRQKPIHLDYRSQETVVVVPEDEDRFILTAKEAARACKQAHDNRDWARQWNDFLVHIHNWCKDRAGLIDAGYVTVGDNALNVLLCVKTAEYNFEFEDAIADLDLELSRLFPLCYADVMQLPNQRDVRAGIPSEELLVVYGDGKRT